MSYTIGTWDAPPDGLLAGTRVEVTRADGKGFTCCRVTGPRAAEIRDFVRARAEHVADRERAGAEARGPARRTPHVRCALAGDYACGARSVQVYGRLRQTRDVIAKALEHYSFHLATAVPGVPVPTIRLVPHLAAPGATS